jgi:hypothetical protein
LHGTASTFKLPDFTVSDNCKEKRNLCGWNKSSDLCLNSLSPNGESKEELKKRWNKGYGSLNTTNNSTLSLHIAAYENSIEATTSDIVVEKVDDCKREKFDSKKQFVSHSTIQVIKAILYI